MNGEWDTIEIHLKLDSVGANWWLMVADDNSCLLLLVVGCCSLLLVVGAQIIEPCYITIIRIRSLLCHISLIFYQMLNLLLRYDHSCFELSTRDRGVITRAPVASYPHLAILS